MNIFRRRRPLIGEPLPVSTDSERNRTLIAVVELWLRDNTLRTVIPDESIGTRVFGEKYMQFPPLQQRVHEYYRQLEHMGAIERVRRRDFLGVRPTVTGEQLYRDLTRPGWQRLWRAMIPDVRSGIISAVMGSLGGMVTFWLTARCGQ